MPLCESTSLPANTLVRRIASEGAASGADDGVFLSPAAARWYVVHTHPHCEMRVVDHLQRQKFDGFCPRTRKAIRHSRRYATKLAPLFPSYVFVSFDPDERPWRCINGTRGAVRLITCGDVPAPVPVGVVEQLQAMTVGNGALNWISTLNAGDLVRIVDGPFTTLIGTLEHLDPCGRVRVLLDLLGREVFVTLSGEAIFPAA